MNDNLTRRRFGQLAIASAAVAGIGYLANKSSALTLPLLYGVSQEEDNSLVVNTIDLLTNIISDLTDSLASGIILTVGERLTGFTILNGTLVLAITPSRSDKKNNDEDYFPRLIFLGSSPKTVKVSGLKKQYTLLSLLGANDKSLLGLIGKNNGSGNYRIAEIDSKTGAVGDTDKVKLSKDDRFRGLTQATTSTVYTTSVDQDGISTLQELDLDSNGNNKASSKKSNIKVQLKTLNNGVQSLAYEPLTKQLYALASLRYEGINYLYKVDPSKGDTKKLTKFDADYITCASVS